MSSIVLNGEIWDIKEILKVYRWLFTQEATENRRRKWERLPDHFKFTLGHNKKRRWLKLIKDIPSALSSPDCKVKGCHGAVDSRELCLYHYNLWLTTSNKNKLFGIMNKSDLLDGQG